MDDAQYDECDDEYLTEEIEYTISPDKSSLGLINNVEDFTDRNKIFSAMFMASPKSRYRSEFQPRKFAIPNKEIEDQPMSSDTISSVLNKSDKLSSTARARHVPSSRVSRLANFSSLGIGLGLGTVAEASRRIVSFGNQQGPAGSVLLSEVRMCHWTKDNAKTRNFISKKVSTFLYFYAVSLFYRLMLIVLYPLCVEFEVLP